jgi:hypothetical protein
MLSARNTLARMLVCLVHVHNNAPPSTGRFASSAEIGCTVMFSPFRLRSLEAASFNSLAEIRLNQTRSQSGAIAQPAAMSGQNRSFSSSSTFAALGSAIR